MSFARFLVIGLAFFPAACASSQPTASLPIASARYALDEKLIVLSVQVNGSPAWRFLLDSGASHSVLDPRLTKELGLVETKRSETTGTGAGAVPVGHVGPVTFTFAGFSLPVEDPWVIDLSGVPVHPDTRGLVGSELFRRYVVRIDPEAQMLTVWNPKEFKHAEGGSFIPLEVDGEKLFIPATLEVKPGLTVNRRLRVDTGSGSSVNDSSVAQSLEIKATVLGGGLGTNEQGVSGRLQAVRLGPYRIADVWGPGGARSAIGMEMMRRFVVTFDAPNGRMHLQPNAAFSEKVPAPN